MRAELASLAKAALNSSQLQQFHDELATQALPDSFGVLTDPDLVEMLTAKLGGTVAEWITRDLTWDEQKYGPQLGPNFVAEDQLLHLLWQDLDTKLARGVEAVSAKVALSTKGAILCFFGRAQLTIIVQYTRSGGGAVDLRPLAVVENPAGVLELEELFHRQPPNIRNLLKKSAVSVDKLVFQRGTIVHVDRQREDVFGPTIDTVILGELIAETLESRMGGSKMSAMEIGCGSGLLTALLASSSHIAELTALDISEPAIACTLKNLQVNGYKLDQSTIRVRGERFIAAHYPEKIDLVVCNPPYIPDSDEARTTMAPYGRAVAGIELGVDILKALPALLSDGGALLLMTTSVSHKDVMQFLPAGFEWRPALTSEGRRVPLDVDNLWQRPEWRDELLNENRIELDSEGQLWHHLLPVWVSRSGVKN